MNSMGQYASSYATVLKDDPVCVAEAGSNLFTSSEIQLLSGASFVEDSRVHLGPGHTCKHVRASASCPTISEEVSGPHVICPRINLGQVDFGLDVLLRGKQSSSK